MKCGACAPCSYVYYKFLEAQIQSVTKIVLLINFLQQLFRFDPFTHQAIAKREDVDSTSSTSKLPTWTMATTTTSSLRHLLEESKKLEALSEENERIFERLLPGEGGGNIALTNNYRRANTNRRARLFEPNLDEDTENSIDFETHAPLSPTSYAELQKREKQQQLQQYPQRHNDHNNSTPAQPPLPELYSSTSSSSSSASSNIPAMKFHVIAEQCLGVDIKSEVQINDFLRSFTEKDRLLVGVQLMMLFNYYKSDG